MEQPFDKEKLVKGLPSQNKRNWISLVKEELENKGIKYFALLMSRSQLPVYGMEGEIWKVICW